MASLKPLTDEEIDSYGDSIEGKSAPIRPLTDEEIDSLEQNKQERGGVLKFLSTTPTLPMAGGIVFGLAGGGTPASIPLAALGGGLGESGRQLLSRKIGEKSPQTSLEAVKDIGVEGAIQGLSEGIGGLAVKGVAAILKKPAGQLLQLITKIKPEYAETLFKNPKAIIPATMKNAKEAFKKAAEASGLPIEDVSPEIINALKSDAKNTVLNTFQRIKSGEKVTASEAQIAKQALDIAVMPAAKTERNAPLIALYSKIRREFTDLIGKESPELAAANKEYAIAKAGEKFRSLFPRNLDQSPAYFRSGSFPVIGAIAGSRDKDSSLGGAIEGALKGAALSAAISPWSIGTMIAGSGAVRGLAPVARRALASSIAELIARHQSQ